ncbi:MAG: hypothetical protein KC468_38890 [Myxococcales bacterium]|nr:hypothetical protein [Myxococcales bacterium]
MNPSATEIINPFPGPQPYRADDRARFYGREEVARDLAATILAHRCVALFGPSGAGKSSVMQAAVMPELDEEYDFRAAFVDGWPADENPVAWLLYTLNEQLKLVAPEGELGLYESVEWTVRQAFRRSDRPILIYLDQIEQLLFPGRSVAETEAFLDWLDRFVERPLRGLHLVLAMREDYLGRFRDRARGRHRLLENGFRLGPMTVGEMVGAVCMAARDGVPAQSWAAPAMRTLMMQVRVPGQREDDGAEVQAAFAQIVCRALFVERAAQDQRITAAERVYAEPILHRYLENTLDQLGSLRDGALTLMEEQLVAADGSRMLLTEEAAHASGALQPEDLAKVLTELERAAILRAEQHRGSRYFEIGHDWLARKVYERKLERLALLRERERQRELEERRLAAEAEMRAAQAEARRARRTVAIVAALALAAGCGFTAEKGTEPTGSENLPSSGVGPWIKLDFFCNTQLVQPFILDSPNQVSLSEPWLLRDGDRGLHFRLWYENRRDGRSVIEHDRLEVLRGSDCRRFDASLAGTQTVLTAPAGGWEGGNLLGTAGYVGAPSVIEDGGGFRMWYEGGRWAGIGHATSPDGLGWTRSDARASGSSGVGPVLVPDQAWENGTVGSPSVLFDGERYRMWYEGDVLGARAIGYAESADGLSWTKRDAAGRSSAGGRGDVAPVLVATQRNWEFHYPTDPFGRVGQPQVIVQRTPLRTVFLMYYTGNLSGHLERGPDDFDSSIGIAVSEDGLSWEKAPNDRESDTDPANEINPVVAEKLPLALPPFVEGSVNSFNPVSIVDEASIGVVYVPEEQTFFSVWHQLDLINTLIAPGLPPGDPDLPAEDFPGATGIGLGYTTNTPD